MKPFIDTTLRDGEQTPGIAFTTRQKALIARELSDSGVDAIEAGTPIIGRTEQGAIRGIIEQNLSARIITWNRMRIDDIDASIECGARFVHLSAPVSDLHIEVKLHKTREWILEQLEQCADYAVRKGLKFSIGAEDASRADEDFLMSYFRTAEKCGADFIRYADTVGIMSPEKVSQVISLLRKELNSPIDFHGHNDFGLATANAYTALKSGADFVSCTVNGIGERAGNASLEQLAFIAEKIDNEVTGLDLSRLISLSRTVAELSGIPLTPLHPLTGANAFLHESGIHVHGMTRSGLTYQPFDPEPYGIRSGFRFGKHSGLSGLKQALKNYQLDLNEEQIHKLLQFLKTYGSDL